MCKKSRFCFTGQPLAFLRGGYFLIVLTRFWWILEIKHLLASPLSGIKPQQLFLSIWYPCGGNRTQQMFWQKKNTEIKEHCEKLVGAVLLCNNHHRQLPCKHFLSTMRFFAYLLGVLESTISTEKKECFTDTAICTSTEKVLVNFSLWTSLRKMSSNWWKKTELYYSIFKLFSRTAWYLWVY